MVEKNLKFFQGNVGGQCDFDFFIDSNVIITAGADLLAKKINVETGETLSTHDIDETYSISTNPQDRTHIAYGGQDQKVQLIKGLNFDEPYIAMKLKGHINKIVYSPNGKYIAASSAVENMISVYDIERDIVQQARPCMQGVGLNVQFSLNTQYVAVSSCDGFVYVYSMEKIFREEENCLIKSLRISPETSSNPSQILLFSWTSQSNSSLALLALPGNENLQLLYEKADGKWDHRISPIKHDKALVSTVWNNDGSCILTACLDNVIKLWNYSKKELLEYYHGTEGFYNIRYSPFSSYYVILDRSGFISTWQYTLLKTNNDFKKAKRKVLIADDDEEDNDYKDGDDKDNEMIIGMGMGIVGDNKVDIMELDHDQNYRHSDQVNEGYMEKELEIENGVEKMDIQQPLQQQQQEEKEDKEERENGNVEISPMQKMQLLKEVRDLQIANDNSHQIKKPQQQIPFKKHKTYADTLIDCSLQPILYSSSTTLNKLRQFLCWTLFGSISIRNDVSNGTRDDDDDDNGSTGGVGADGVTSYIDIEFTDKSFHKGIITFANTLKLSMGVLNEKGAFFAGKRRDNTANKGNNDDEDLETVDKVHGTSGGGGCVYFKPFFSYIDEEEWTLELNDGETPEAVAIGNDWCAVITDQLYVRIFNLQGLELNVLALEKPLVTCAGYENLLGIVYHDSVPLMGCQSMKLKLINVMNMKIVYEGGLPISGYSKLVWFGFSEGGLIITYDSSEVIRALVNLSNWVPIWSNQGKVHTSKKFWLIGMKELDFIGILLDKDELEPSSITRPIMKSIKCQIPFLDAQDSKAYQEIYKKKLMVDHEKFRNENWLTNKFIREKGDPLYYNSESIKETNEIKALEDNIEKSLLGLFKEYLVNKEFEKAIHLTQLLKSQKSLLICQTFGQKLDIPELKRPLEDIFKMRKTIDEIENAKLLNSNPKNDSLLVIVEKKQTNQYKEKRDKIKKELQKELIEHTTHQKHSSHQFPNQNHSLLTKYTHNKAEERYSSKLEEQDLIELDDSPNNNKGESDMKAVLSGIFKENITEQRNSGYQGNNPQQGLKLGYHSTAMAGSTHPSQRSEDDNNKPKSIFEQFSSKTQETIGSGSQHSDLTNRKRKAENQLVPEVKKKLK